MTIIHINEISYLSLRLRQQSKNRIKCFLNILRRLKLFPPCRPSRAPPKRPLDPDSALNENDINISESAFKSRKSLFQACQRQQSASFQPMRITNGCDPVAWSIYHQLFPREGSHGNQKSGKQRAIGLKYIGGQSQG